MQKSRWERLYEMVDNKFKIEKELSELIEIKKGVKGKREIIIFSTPKGKMRLERLVRPKVEEIKYHYLRRTHRGARQESQYSPTETVEIIKLYRLDQLAKEWREVNISNL